MNARQGLEAFLTPPRSPEFSWETKLLAQAATHRVRLGPNGFARGGDDEIQVYVWGEGPPVLFVHGWGGHAGNHAAGIKAVVQAGGQAIAFDAPAHGRSGGTYSSAPAFTWAMQHVARETGELQGIVAHSLGAGATCLALARDVRTRSAVLLAGCCWVAPVLLEFAQKSGFSEELTAGMLALATEEFNPVDSSAAVNVPQLTDTRALLLHDPEDREMPFNNSAAIAAAWPGATLEEVPKVGHRSILRSQAVVARTCGFVLPAGNSSFATPA